MDQFSWTSNSSGTQWELPASFSIGYPTEGDISTLTHPTRPGSTWFVGMYQEIAAVITYAGLSFNPSDVTQLLTAIQEICNPTFELREDGSFELREDGSFEMRN